MVILNRPVEADRCGLPPWYVTAWFDTICAPFISHMTTCPLSLRHSTSLRLSLL